MKTTSIALASLLASLAAAPALAVPEVLTYAGSLRQGDDAAEGTFSVVVALFDEADGGAPLFTQSDASLDVTAGELIVDLGADPSNPLDDAVLDADALFLSITVDGEELTPRIALTSVPFARRAASAEVADIAEVALEADSVGGLSADDIASLYQAGQGLAKSGTTFSLANNGVSSQHIVDGSVVGADIAPQAISSAHIANGAVTRTQLAPGSVTAGALSNDVVGTAALANDAVTSAKLATNAVTSSEILDNSVSTFDVQNDSLTSADLAANACGPSEIADGAVGATKLGLNSVTSAAIQANAVTASEIAQDAVGPSELAASAVRGENLVNGGIPVFRNHSSCADNKVVTLAEQCITTCSVGSAVPNGCGSCIPTGTFGAGTMTCTNVALGRIVPN